MIWANCHIHVIMDIRQPVTVPCYIICHLAQCHHSLYWHGDTQGSDAVTLYANDSNCHILTHLRGGESDTVLVTSLLCLVSLGLGCIAPPSPSPTAAPTTAAPVVGSCRCGQKGGVGTKIVGGSSASRNEYPWQVNTWSNDTNPHKLTRSSMPGGAGEH